MCQPTPLIYGTKEVNISRRKLDIFALIVFFGCQRCLIGQYWPFDPLDYGYFGINMKPPKKKAQNSFREILRLCYFLALVRVDPSLVVVVDIFHDRGFLVSFFWIASRSNKIKLGPWVVIG
jgi:hypothetical protein